MKFAGDLKNSESEAMRASLTKMMNTGTIILQPRRRETFRDFLLRFKYTEMCNNCRKFSVARPHAVEKYNCPLKSLSPT